MSQNNRPNLAGWAAILTAIATLITAIGFPNYFLHIVGKLNPNKVPQPISWNGVYGDYRKDLNNQKGFKPYIATEEIELIFSENEVIGKSKATGAGSNAQRWEQSGYKKNDFIVFAYQRVDENVPGIGTYFLERQGDDSDTYVGYWEGLDCNVKNIIHCPYVLSKDSVEDINKDFQQYLQTPCEEVGSPSSFSSCS